MVATAKEIKQAEKAAAKDYWFIELIEQLGGELQIAGLDKAAFIGFCEAHPELLIERDQLGHMILHSPVFGGSGYRESQLIFYLVKWQKEKKEGMVFSSAVGFDLPDGSTRSPDASWLSEERLAALSSDDIEQRFIPAVPDFIIELKSKSDSLKKLQSKMQTTWIDNGVRLGWLIDPYKENAYIYRADGTIDVVKNFDKSLSGETILPDFILDLQEFRLLKKEDESQ